MRRWGLFFLVLVLVAGGVLGWALLNVNRYLNDNRAWIEAQAESALGRQVSLGEIGISLWGGFGATIADLEVADDPAFSDQPFVQASGVRVNVALLPALLGRIEVREVVLEAPVVRLIRTKAGMNVDSIGAAAPEKTPTPEPPEAPSDEGSGAAAMALVVALVTIDDGEIDYTDRTVSPPSSQVLRDLDLRVTDLGTSEPASLSLAVAVLGSAEQNLTLSGDVGPLPLSTVEDAEPIALDLSLEIGPAALALLGTVQMGPPLSIDLKVDSNDAPLEGLSALVPELAGYELSGTAAVHVAVKGRVDGAALPALTGDVALSDVAARVGDSSDEIEGMSAKLEFLGEATRLAGEVRIDRGQVQNADFTAFLLQAKLADDVASLDGIELSLFGGTYTGKGRYDFRDGKNPRFDLRQDLRNLDVAQILESQAPDAAGRMTGTLSGSLEVSGAGDNGDAIRQSLRGQGAVAVADGVLVGVNLPEAILQSLTGVSGLTGLLSDELRSKYVDIFSADDTSFEKLSASIVIADQKATTDDAVVAARDYALRGEGSVDFEGQLDFTAKFVASEGLTADVIKSVREVRYITNADDRLEVPVKIVGTLPEVKVEPDAAFVARSLTKGALGKGLELLGGGRKDEPTDAPADEAADEKEKRPEEVGAELIERGIRGLFGD